MGQKERSGVYLCKNDYLMEKPTVPDKDSVQRNIKAIQNFYKRYSDVKMHMMVVPNAVTVLKDYLPKHAPVRDQMKDWKKVQKKLPKGMDVISVSEALNEHKEEGVFYRTDHHWTSLWVSKRTSGSSTKPTPSPTPSRGRWPPRAAVMR